MSSTRSFLGNNEIGPVKVIHGANVDRFPIAGTTVFMVSRNLADAFNIPLGAISFVDGEEVSDDYLLQGGDTLEFVFPNGTKEGSSFFRYPGGKFRLRQPIIELITPHLTGKVQYREPFFGGGGIGLQLLEECPELLSSVWLNDRDIGIAALWTSVIRFPNDLQQRVLSFKPTPEAFANFKSILLENNELPKTRAALVELGFRKLAIHQMSYSGLGVMAGGPLSAINSRWSPKHICQKVEQISRALAVVDVHSGCCTSLDFETMLGGDDNFVYLDPPYYLQGPALYRHAFDRDDHVRLARVLRHRTGPWLLSYDDCPEVRAMYNWATVRELPVTYSISQTKRRSELLIQPETGSPRSAVVEKEMVE